MKKMLTAVVLFLAPVLTYAADSANNLPGTSKNSANNIPGSETLINPLGTTDLMGFLLNILNFIITKIAPIVIILMLVYIGFLFTTTSVNPENKQKAKEYLLWTVVGALILLGATAIADGIQATVQALSTG